MPVFFFLKKITNFAPSKVPIIQTAVLKAIVLLYIVLWDFLKIPRQGEEGDLRRGSNSDYGEIRTFLEKAKLVPFSLKSRLLGPPRAGGRARASALPASR